jgi:hypothetical protein
MIQPKRVRPEKIDQGRLRVSVKMWCLTSPPPVSSALEEDSIAANCALSPKSSPPSVWQGQRAQGRMEQRDENLIAAVVARKAVQAGPPTLPLRGDWCGDSTGRFGNRGGSFPRPMPCAVGRGRASLSTDYDTGHTLLTDPITTPETGTLRPACPCVPSS